MSLCVYPSMARANLNKIVWLVTNTTTASKIYFIKTVFEKFQLMLILVLLGKYFDAVVVFVTSQTLLFRLALAIL